MEVTTQDIIKLVTTMTDGNTTVAKNQEKLIDAIDEQSLALKEATTERITLKDNICETGRKISRVREDQITHNEVVDTIKLDIKDLIKQTTNFSEEDAAEFAKTVKRIEEFRCLGEVAPAIVNIIKDIEDGKIIKRIKFLINGILFSSAAIAFISASTGLFLFIKYWSNK